MGADRRLPRAPAAFRETECSCPRNELRAVAEAAGARVPAGVGAERRRDHRRAHARDVVAVAIDRRHQHGVRLARRARRIAARHQRRAAPCRMPCSKRGPKSSSGRAVVPCGVHHAGDRGELARPLGVADQRAVGAAWECGWRAAACRRSPSGPSRRAWRGTASRWHTTLEKFCWPGPRAGGLCCGSAKCCELDQQIDAHRLGLRQIVALRVGVHQRAAAHPVFRAGLGMDHQRIGFRPLQDGVLAGRSGGRSTRHRRTGTCRRC